VVLGVVAAGRGEGVVLGVTVVPGVDVVLVLVVDVEVDVEVVEIDVEGAGVPDVDAAGGELVMGAASGFFMAATECSGHRRCPCGPVAEATAPKLMVAASAAEAPARR
jgi:hypothetical protein